MRRRNAAATVLAACKTLANPSASKPEDTTPESSKGGYGTHLRHPTPLASTLAKESAVKQCQEDHLAPVPAQASLPCVVPSIG